MCVGAPAAKVAATTAVQMMVAAPAPQVVLMQPAPMMMVHAPMKVWCPAARPRPERAQRNGAGVRTRGQARGKQGQPTGRMCRQRQNMGERITAILIYGAVILFSWNKKTGLKRRLKSCCGAKADGVQCVWSLRHAGVLRQAVPTFLKVHCLGIFNTFFKTVVRPLEVCSIISYWNWLLKT